LQCLLLVRDEFWLPLSRFLHGVEIRLQEGVNCGLMDLFDPLHARKVLSDFGRAFGQIPETGEASPDVQKFIERAVGDLAENGKIAPVRLSLFAEMAKSKPWSGQTLQQMGGAQRTGEAFLEGAFGLGASPARRQCAPAARAVLEALLPKLGTAIKGHMRTREELRTLAGYAHQPKAFEELMNLLVLELRLVSPAARELEEQSAPPGKGAPTTPFHPAYQLTHDYLVASIRRWLTLQMRETHRGRSMLRLAQCSEWWNASPEDRHLPALLEWLGIRWFTSSRDWKEGGTRMMRRADRYYLTRGATVLLVLLSVLLTGGYLYRADKQRRRHEEADVLVERLQSIRSSQWSHIHWDVHEYREWIVPRLHAILQSERAAPTEKLYVRLALLPEDREQLAPIESALLEVGPEELKQIAIVLQPYQDEVVPRLWQVLANATAPPEHRLRAAAALAIFDPKDARWETLAAVPVNELAINEHESLHEWILLLRPVRAALVPHLVKMFRDGHLQKTRTRTALALTHYSADQPTLLGDLLLDADTDQFRALWPAVPAHARAIAERMEQEIRRSSPEARAEKATWAAHRARAGVILLRVGRPDGVWPLFVHGPDPQVRSYLVDSLGPYQVDPTLVVSRLATERDSTARHALLLSLGGFAPDAIVQNRELIAQLVTSYRTEPDPGVRAAAEWLLRHWHHDDLVTAVDQQLSARGASWNSGKPRWYVNGEGFTMVAVTPSKFVMGSPPTERGRNDNETPHERSISRTYAIATKCVSVTQWERFLKQHPLPRADDPNESVLYDPLPNSSVTFIDWYVAAKYCRWLSEQEGIPEDEMCYPPIAAIKAGMKLPPRCLERTGYRLPTEAEWEYACRAGTVTARYYGDTEDLLDRYAWYFGNADDHAWPAALKKPNDLGLFDLLGNVGQWTHSRFVPYPTDAATDEDDEVRIVVNDQRRVLRGGNFTRRPAYLRAAMRFPNLPTYSYVNIGFRVARTCR
jgi:formylglycine-generating enzyme required for sulfatase activity